jgi:hypothetical protein
VATYLDPRAGRYKESINANFPSLLIKRFKKGNLSSFSLESAITTERAKAFFRSMGKLDDMDVLVIDEEGGGTGTVLVGVWERFWEAKKEGAPSTLYYVKGTWDELKEGLPDDKLAYGDDDDSNRHGLTQLHPPGPSPNLPKLVTTPTRPTPVRSVSLAVPPASVDGMGTIGGGGFGAKASRARLQPIDTSDSITRRPSLPALNVSKARKSPSPLKIDRGFSSAASSFSSTSTAQSPIATAAFAESPATPRVSMQTMCVHQRNTSIPSIGSASNPATTPTTISPASASSEPFVVSNILSGSLFLGPEPTTDAEIDELIGLGVRRVLNVALECDAEGRWDQKFEKVKRMGMRDWLEEKDVQGRIDEACDWLGVIFFVFLVLLGRIC